MSFTLSCTVAKVVYTVLFFNVVINYGIEQQLKLKHKSKLKYLIRRHVNTQTNTYIHNNKRLKLNGLHYDCLCGKKHKHKCPDYGRHLYGQYKCMLFVGIELVSIKSVL